MDPGPPRAASRRCRLFRGEERRRGRVFTSSSSSRRPSAVSTRKIRPGRSRPRRTTRAGSMSSTPTSLASTTRLVAGHPVRGPGRRPLPRSSTAPITAPSIKAISAGPSRAFHQRRVEQAEPARRLTSISRRGSPTAPGSSSAARGCATRPYQVEQLRALVERAGVRAVGIDDREQPLDPPALLRLPGSAASPAWPRGPASSSGTFAPGRC